MEQNTRPLCNVDGCNKPAMSKGKGYYAKECNWHHKRIYNFSRPTYALRKDSCEICGWNKGHCDVHRIKLGRDGGEYVPENVMTLCPNCHRLIHLGIDPKQ